MRGPQNDAGGKVGGKQSKKCLCNPKVISDFVSWDWILFCVARCSFIIKDKYHPWKIKVSLWLLEPTHWWLWKGSLWACWNFHSGVSPTFCEPSNSQQSNIFRARIYQNHLAPVGKTTKFRWQSAKGTARQFCWWKLVTAGKSTWVFCLKVNSTETNPTTIPKLARNLQVFSLERGSFDPLIEEQKARGPKVLWFFFLFSSCRCLWHEPHFHLFTKNKRLFVSSFTHQLSLSLSLSLSDFRSQNSSFETVASFAHRYDTQKSQQLQVSSVLRHGQIWSGIVLCWSIPIEYRQIAGSRWEKESSN